MTAVLLVFLWLRERQTWMLVTATLLMCGACAGRSARASSSLRSSWLRPSSQVPARSGRSGVPLSFSVCVVGAVAIPWRLWYIAHGVAGEGARGRPPSECGHRTALGVAAPRGSGAVRQRVLVGHRAGGGRRAGSRRAGASVDRGGVLRLARRPRHARRRLDHVGDPRARDHGRARRKPDRPFHGCSCPAVRGRRAAASRRRLVVVRQRAERGSFEMVAPGARGNRRGRRRSGARVPARRPRSRRSSPVPNAERVRRRRRLRTHRVSTWCTGGSTIHEPPENASGRSHASGSSVQQSSSTRAVAGRCPTTRSTRLAQGEALAKQVRAAGFDARVELES